MILDGQNPFKRVKIMGFDHYRPEMTMMPTFSMDSSAGKVVERKNLPSIVWSRNRNSVILVVGERGEHCHEGYAGGR